MGLLPIPTYILTVILIVIVLFGIGVALFFGLGFAAKENNANDADPTLEKKVKKQQKEIEELKEKTK